MTENAPAAPLADTIATTSAALSRLQDVLRQLGDGDLARAHRGGGWSVAQVVSHINVSTLLWTAAVQRVAADPALEFFFREEVGHDAVGYPPPTVDLAVAQLDSTRRTITTAFPLVETVADRTVEIPDLGTLSIGAWTPLIAGHLTGHVDQALDIMRDRAFAPAGV